MKVLAWILFFIVLWTLYGVRKAETPQQLSRARFEAIFVTLLWIHTSILSQLP